MVCATAAGGGVRLFCFLNGSSGVAAGWMCRQVVERKCWVEYERARINEYLYEATSRVAYERENAY